MSYCIDTSALIAAWSERYLRSSSASFFIDWTSWIRAGRPSRTEEVRLGGEEEGGWLFDWVNERRGMFVDLEPAIQARAKEILRAHPWLLKNMPDKSPADPFVIALAMERSLTVVTEEAPGSAKKPKIPIVCSTANVECINLVEFLTRELPS